MQVNPPGWWKTHLGPKTHLGAVGAAVEQHGQCQEGRAQPDQCDEPEPRSNLSWDVGECGGQQKTDIFDGNVESNFFLLRNNFS